MTQQARSILDLSLLATGAIAYARAVNVAATTAIGAIGGVQATVSGQKVVGVARRAAAVGAYVDVTCTGTAVVEAGAAIALGARVMCDTSGRAVTATVMTATVGSLIVGAGAVAVTSTAANGAIITGAPTLLGGDTPLYIWGTALQAAAAAGDLIEVLITH